MIFQGNFRRLRWLILALAVAMSTGLSPATALTGARPAKPATATPSSTRHSVGPGQVPERSAKPAARSATKSARPNALALEAADQAAFSGHVSYSADGLGEVGSGGSLRADVPAGSTVLQATLYGTYFSAYDLTPPDYAVVLDGTTVTTTLIATAASEYFATSRADVTALVKAKVVDGGGITSFTVGNDPLDLNGVALLVIYSNPSLPNASIAFGEGAADLDGQRQTFTFADPVDTTTPGFSAEMSLGIGHGWQNSPGHTCGPVQQYSWVDVDNRRISSCAGNYDDGGSGGQLGTLITVGGIGDSIDNPSDPLQQAGDKGNPRVNDDELYDVSSFIKDGDQSITVDTVNPPYDDVIFLTVVKVTGRGVPTFISRPTVETFGNVPGFGYASDPVNTASGNFTDQALDLTSPFDLLRLTRTYNSLDRSTGPFGQGWSSKLTAQIAAASNGSMMFHNEDGRILAFEPNGLGGWLRPPDLDADLTESENGWDLSFIDGDTWHFGAGGWLTSITRDGESVVLARGDDGRVTTLRHSSGASEALAYDPAGHLISATGSDGRRASWAYADDGTLHTATAPGGAVTTYVVGPAAEISQITDPSGVIVVANTYDENGRVARQDYPNGGGATFDYDDATGETTVTSTVDGAKLKYQHDSQGRVVMLTDPDGKSAVRSYDAEGRLLSAADRTGADLARTWDKQGNLSSETLGGATSRYTYDSANRITSSTDPLGAVTRFTYNGTQREPSTVTDPLGAVSTNVITDGRLRSTTTPQGAKTTYTYDAADRLTSSTDPAGGTTVYDYDAAGHQTSVTSPLGNITRHAYDEGGRMISSTDPTGAATSYDYDAAGRVLTSTNQAGAVTKYEYDAAGYQTEVIDPLGRTTTRSYDRQGDLSSLTDAGGARADYQSDTLGRPAKLTDVTGAETTYRQDANGALTGTSGPAGQTTTSYDERGNPLSVTDEAGAVIKYTYDADDRVITQTTPGGLTTSIDYDAGGQVIKTTDAAGAVKTYTWTADGQMATSTDALGNATKYSYDVMDRLTSVTDPLGAVSKISYDAEGHRVAVSSASGLVTRYAFDPADRLVTVTDPRGGTSRTEYDPRGLVISQQSPSGAIAHSGYDAAGQLTSVTNALGAVTRYSYDDAGNLVTATDAKGAITKYGYDSAGREVSRTDPLDRVTTRSYDDAGNVSAVTDSTGTISSGYDRAGLLTKRTGSDGAVQSFTYDESGQRTSMTDDKGTTKYTYDLAGHLLCTDGPGGKVCQSYDAVGRRTSLTYPDGGVVTYGYDTAGHLTSMKDPKAGAAEYTVDADGRLLKEALPSSWSRSYTYSGGELSKYVEGRGTGGTDTTTLTRDADGRVTSSKTGSAVQRFTYDKAGELLRATGQAGGDLAATYDAVGNRTSLATGPSTSQAKYDSADELLSDSAPTGNVTYQYDSAGRLVGEGSSDSTVTATYDGFGLPQSVVTKTGSVTETRTLGHDGTGLLTSLRTARSAGSATSITAQTWTYDDGRTPQILAQQGMAPASFSYGYGRTFARTSSASAPFSRDALGSTLTTSDTTGWAEASAYDAFGNPTAGTATDDSSRFGYRSELQSGSEVYLRSRSLDSSSGRFTSKDPLDGVAGTVGPQNPYLYGDNDPVNQIDPLGQRPISDDDFQLSNDQSDDCPEPNNSLDAHPKCFQGHIYQTRGFYPNHKGCLDGNDDCLNDLWQLGQKERAAQALTLHKLDLDRQGFGDKVLDHWLSTRISKNVDWEVGPKDNYIGTFRMDIVTDERGLFEVKRFSPAAQAEVADQLARYLAATSNDGVELEASPELDAWAAEFHVGKGFWDFISGGDTVYVWGLGNLPGHIYFAKEDRAPKKVRAKVQQQEGLCLICASVPVGVPVEAPPPVLVP